ncbi:MULTISPECIES: AMP-binding protein [Pseudomonas]|uniref:AMP-binding protein n=1 Tax=Pseudomonas TaxID=286 RepID=UPI000CFDE8DE|nr:MULTISPECIES: AMP-binding protein [Pseudomonas]PQZ91320.1 hypothetical protein CQ048_12565 [Pseudomonas trivialis]PRB27187.1 hypothetical protein CQ041_10810 [Pseudomonas sp. MYb60]
MSVHALEQPRVLEWPAERLDYPPTALAQLHHWAQATPLHTALRHKRQGQWHAWRWIDVSRDVGRVADGLRQHGFSEVSRLLLSGVFEPNLLLLALAAQSVGGQVLTVADEVADDDLLQSLERIQPTHVYTYKGAHWPGQRLDFAELLGPAEPADHLTRWWQPVGETALWSDQTTGCRGALALLLEQWLSSGQGLAFPESPASAERDRREVAPLDTWRRLCDWATAKR